MRGKKARALRRQAYRMMRSGLGSYGTNYDDLKRRYLHMESARNADHAAAKDHHAFVKEMDRAKTP